jgi:hypothetical protein
MGRHIVKNMWGETAPYEVQQAAFYALTVVDRAHVDIQQKELRPVGY